MSLRDPTGTSKDKATDKEVANDVIVEATTQGKEKNDTMLHGISNKQRVTEVAVVTDDDKTATTADNANGIDEMATQVLLLLLPPKKPKRRRKW